MKSPKVRTIDQLSKEVDPIYAPQREIIKQQQTLVQNQGTQAVAGLDAARVNAFGQIDQTAARRKALFSGFGADQQARYLGEKYLPSLAELQMTTQKSLLGLGQNLAELGSRQTEKALGMREDDLSRLYDYEKTQDTRKWESKQAEIAYNREMKKLREEQRFTASQNAANRASSAASSAASQPTTAQFLVQAFSGYDHSKANFYTEREVIPAVMANYGLSKKDAEKLVYGYRKSTYGV